MGSGENSGTVQRSIVVTIIAESSTSIHVVPPGHTLAGSPLMPMAITVISHTTQIVIANGHHERPWNRRHLAVTMRIPPIVDPMASIAAVDGSTTAG